MAAVWSLSSFSSVVDDINPKMLGGRVRVTVALLKTGDLGSRSLASSLVLGEVGLPTPCVITLASVLAGLRPSVAVCATVDLLEIGGFALRTLDSSLGFGGVGLTFVCVNTFASAMAGSGLSLLALSTVLGDAFGAVDGSVGCVAVGVVSLDSPIDSSWLSGITLPSFLLSSDMAAMSTSSILLSTISGNEFDVVAESVWSVEVGVSSRSAVLSSWPSEGGLPTSSPSSDVGSVLASLEMLSTVLANVSDVVGGGKGLEGVD